MKYLLALIICASLISVGEAQVRIDENEKVEIQNLVTETLNKLVDEGTIKQKAVVAEKPRSIDDEVKVVLADIAQYPEYDKSNWVYFTFYNINDVELLKKYYLELTFWVNSLSSEGIVRAPQPVIGSPTLFKVDIRDYGWTQKAWEKVSIREPYIREPWIDHSTYSALRLEGGNNLIRGDWFLTHTSNPLKQLDVGDKEILYETLLYAKLGRSPKNLQEFYDYWGYDVKKLETKLHKVEQILVPHGKSGVARNNRILARIPTELGYLYSSSDFLNSTGKKNVIENLNPDIMMHPNRDAGEHIGTNQVGLQVYLVTNAKDENVWQADERVAFDRTDVKDVTVVAGKSCVICHSQGINVPYNGLLGLLQKNVNLRYADKEFKLKADRTYFGPLSRIYDDPSRETLMEKDRQNFNDAVKDTNGLDGNTNARYFKECLDWYEQDITLELAAAECGVTVEEFQTKVIPTASGRLGELANGGTVSRQEWEDPQNGYFAQSMLLLKSINKTIIQNVYENSETVIEKPQVEELAPSVLSLEIVKATYLKSGKTRLATLKAGEIYEILGQEGNWYKIKSGNQVGYVYNSYVSINQ